MTEFFEPLKMTKEIKGKNMIYQKSVNNLLTPLYKITDMKRKLLVIYSMPHIKIAIGGLQ